MPGRPRKPTALKIIAGTARKDRMTPPPGVELPLVSDVLPPPDWLPNTYAVEEWNRLAPILAANRLLTEGGLSALAMLCAAHGIAAQAFAAGEVPRSALLAQLRGFSSDFGLTPVSAGRVRPAAGNESAGNPFSGNGRRRPR